MLLPHHFPLFLWLLVSLSFAEELNVLKNTTQTIALKSTAGDTQVQYNFSLQRNTFMVRINATVGKESLPASDFGVLPNVFIETNASVPLEESRSVRGFLHLTSFDNDWNDGLILSKENNEVYKVSGSWNSPSNKSLNYKVQMYVASKATVYQGISLNPNEVVWISNVIDFPFLIQNSFLALDEVFLSGAVLSNNTVPGAFVFSSDNVTQLYINSSVLMDGKNHSILIANIRADSLWSRFESGDNTTRNLSGRNVDDALIVFLDSNDAKNITFEQRLVYNHAPASAASVANRGNTVRSRGCHIGGMVTVISVLLLPLLLC